MPPQVAALLTIGFIFVLFVRDLRTGKQASAALWLPVLWLAIISSRFVSQWINLGPLNYNDISGGTEGSPIDAAYFGSLILAGSIVLVRRRIAIAEFMRKNPWLTALIVYGLLSVVWSDFPVPSFKRWIKWSGQVVMALIILTDPNPIKALRTVLKRCAYVLIPASILFVKYYPQYGRSYEWSTGTIYYNGVGLSKNSLGYVCLILGLFFVWNLFATIRFDNLRARRQELILSVGFLCMIAWLLTISDSKTPLVALFLGTAAMLSLSLPMVNRRYFGVYVFVAVLIVIAAEVTFDVYANVVQMLGRDPTLTDRTVVWREILPLQDRPILGFGFESFWLDPRLEAVWAKKLFPVLNQAHNLYLETYLQLGAIGLLLLLALLISTFFKNCKQLLTDFEFARLKLANLVAFLLYNVTEATIGGLHPLWMIFLISAIDCPIPRSHMAKQSQAMRTS